MHFLKNLDFQVVLPSGFCVNQAKFDQKEIDEALDKKRSDEILHGGDITEVKNEDLFVIDTGKGKKKEPVKSEF